MSFIRSDCTNNIAHFNSNYDPACGRQGSFIIIFVCADFWDFQILNLLYFHLHILINLKLFLICTDGINCINDVFYFIKSNNNLICVCVLVTR